MRLLVGVLPLCLTAVATGQRGDRPGEDQALLPATVVVPEAVPRSPADAQATLRVAPGFAVSLFAAEPLVCDPVAVSFDPSGRLWVVEMRGYMNDLDARGEHLPNGRIVVLRDADHDGRADTSHVFAEDLVLPRAVLPLRGGVLVVTPPELVWLPDADGDLRADGRTTVMGGFEAGLDNPEHSGNGLLWSFDHRIHLANDARLVHWSMAGFRVEPGAGGGQWGITHDDRGRHFFNYNEDWLRCDLVPGRYGPLAQPFGGLPQLNHRVCQDRTVWPVRITPGVNRGYQPGRLVDWVLAIHTAVCAPHVYRGGWLPCDGDVFICEPAGNLVRRVGLRQPDGALQGENVYQAQRQEFLASTDERFRPVHLATGFDGALYVVDMYRGVIQHRNFVTTFLRRQIEARGLERPIGLGRIWRIVPAGVPAPPPAPVLHDAAGDQLVAALSHGNGTVRDLALRELVQRQLTDTAPALRDLLRTGATPAVRIAAASALVGLGALQAEDARAGLRDPDPGVLTFLLPQLGPLLAAGDAHLWLALARLGQAGPDNVRWHVALAMADVGKGLAPRWRPARLQLLVDLLASRGDDAMLRAAVAVGAGDDLVDVLGRMLSREPAPASRPAAARDLAARAMKSKRAALQQALFELAASTVAPASQLALLQGAVDGLPKGAARAGWLVLPASPRSLVQLTAQADAPLARLAQELIAAVAVVGTPVPGAVAELTTAEQAVVRTGQQVFARACAACHQLDGNGMQGLAPPLRDSEWVLGPADRLSRIVLGGLRGPIDVNGTTWSLEMPAQRQLSDADLAAALSYVRRAFGHAASVVTVDAVAAVRKATASRSEPWTAQELLQAK